MNYYQHHIGDFNNATRHLSRTERSIYRDLIDLYYDSEKPLTADIEKLARKILVEDGDRGALREVLNEFFVPMEDGYHNDRCDKEIAAYQRMAEGGKLGAVKRWAKGSDSPPIAPLSRPQAKGNANHEPITNNHKPIKHKRVAAQSDYADLIVSVNPQIFSEWKKVRKVAVTRRVIEGIDREAQIAGLTLEQAMTICIERGWRGFEASWVLDRNKNGGQQHGKHAGAMASIFAPPEEYPSA